MLVIWSKLYCSQLAHAMRVTLLKCASFFYAYGADVGDMVIYISSIFPFHFMHFHNIKGYL